MFRPISDTADQGIRSDTCLWQTLTGCQKFLGRSSHSARPCEHCLPTALQYYAKGDFIHLLHYQSVLTDTSTKETAAPQTGQDLRQRQLHLCHRFSDRLSLSQRTPSAQALPRSSTRTPTASCCRALLSTSQL